MTPILAREIAEQIVDEAFLTNWKVYGVLFALLIVSSALSAFATAFFRKRGETAANSRDFQELIRQLRETTTAAEEVRTAITSTDLASREWRALRRTKLEELLVAAYALKEWLDADQSHRLFQGSHPGASPVSKVETISRLYFPELHVQISHLVIAFHDSTRWVAQIQHNILGAGQNLERRTEILQTQYLGNLEEKHTAILAGLAGLEQAAPALMREIAGA